MSETFWLIDVFGKAAFSGNPLAVVVADGAMTGEEMQRITCWLNLSETTFLLPPTDPRADYRVRIFTTARELPFAGHPSLGTCHAWLAAGGRPHAEDRVLQECGIGLVPLRRDGRDLAFKAPPLLRSGEVGEAELVEIAGLLRIERAAIVAAQWADNGPGWIAVMLASAEEVLAVEPARHHDRRIDIGLFGPHPTGGETAFEVRAFFAGPNGALVEDPVTGSLNASIAQWLFASGRVTSGYVAAQGTRLGRSGRVKIERDSDGGVWVGGRTVTLFSGMRAGTAPAY